MYDQKLKDEFSKSLRLFQKDECLSIIKNAVESKEIDIIPLYTEILAPSLMSIAGNESKQEIGVWAEHIQSSIVRTIIESVYACYISPTIKTEQKKPKTVIFCPEEEYHELGARMASDFLTLLGFDAYFIGANTPAKEAIHAIQTIKPILVTISVTNFFHLAHLNTLIEALRSNYHESFSIAVGGYAVDHSPHAKEKIHADFFAHSFEDLAAIKEVLLPHATSL